MSAQEIIAILESQVKGTMLIIYNMLAGYPTITQVLQRREDHWCLACDKEYSGVIFKSCDVVENMRFMEHPWEAALVDWSGAVMIDLTELRD